MTVEEIMAEKVRAIIYSGAPRYLYDLNYFLCKQISLDPDLVKTKISIYGEDFSIEKFSKSIEEMKKDWVEDLGPLLPQDPPPFNKVSVNVLQKIYEIIK